MTRKIKHKVKNIFRWTCYCLGMCILCCSCVVLPALLSGKHKSFSSICQTLKQFNKKKSQMEVDVKKIIANVNGAQRLMQERQKWIGTQKKHTHNTTNATEMRYERLWQQQKVIAHKKLCEYDPIIIISYNIYNLSTLLVKFACVCVVCYGYWSQFCCKNKWLWVFSHFHRLCWCNWDFIWTLALVFKANADNN